MSMPALPDGTPSRNIDLDDLTRQLLEQLQHAEAEQTRANERVWGIRGQLELVTQLRQSLTQPEEPHAPPHRTLFRCILIALLLLLGQPPASSRAENGIVDPGSPPHVTVVWEASRQARVEWTGYGSMLRVPKLTPETWLNTAANAVERLQPGGDQSRVPAPGDRYELRSVETGAVLASAELEPAPYWYHTYLPLVRR